MLTGCYYFTAITGVFVQAFVRDTTALFYLVLYTYSKYREPRAGWKPRLIGPEERV